MDVLVIEPSLALKSPLVPFCLEWYISVLDSLQGEQINTDSARKAQKVEHLFARHGLDTRFLHVASAAA